MTADWGQGEMRCHRCETGGKTKVPGGPLPHPPVPATQSSSSQMSLSSDSSVNSGGSSYSQRSTKRNPRRRHIPTKSGTSAISNTTTKSGKSTAATSTTTTITPAPSQRPHTRRSMQPSIDTMLRPRGGRTSTVLPLTRSRGTNNPKNNA